MGFTLTLLYLALNYLTPTLVVPALADYHIQLWIGILAFLSSLAGVRTSGLLKAPQWWLLLMFIIVIALSLIANHWMGGVIPAMQDFLPEALSFYLIAINWRSLARMRLSVAVLVAIAALFVYIGASSVITEDVKNNPYVAVQSLDKYGLIRIYRIRALSALSDPNDFAQFLLALTPLIWLFTEPGRKMRSMLICVPLTLIMLTGVFLTHSRGGMVATCAIMLLAFRRKLGTTGSAVITGCALLGFMALNFTGGREISTEGGMDRLDLWGMGIGFIRANPLFGVGYNRFSDASHSLTAHNTYVLCSSELGLVGYFFWVTMVVLTLTQLHHVKAKLALVKDEDVKDEKTLHAGDAPRPADKPSELIRAATLMQLSLTAFFVTAWFLSRAYIMLMWVLMGLAVSISLQARPYLEALGEPDPPMSKVYKRSLAAVTASLGLVYILIHVRMR